jgi:hypothetical protein
MSDKGQSRRFRRSTPRTDILGVRRHVRSRTYRSLPLYVRGCRDSAQQERLCVDLVHEDEWNSMRCIAFYGSRKPCAPVSSSARLASDFTRTYGGATMSRVKQASKQKRTTKAAAAKVLGAAGLSFSLVGGTSASTMPTSDIPQFDNTSPNQRFVLSDEEMADVSLATFYVFDRENLGTGVQLARGCGGCGGCGGRGCGGCGGGRGCGGGCGGRGCGGFGFGGCRGCGGGCGFGGFWFGGCVGCVACVACAGAGCCGSWGACRLC